MGSGGFDGRPILFDAQIEIVELQDSSAHLRPRGIEQGYVIRDIQWTF